MTLNALVWSRNLLFFTFLDHLRVDEEVFIDRVITAGNVVFAERLATILLHHGQGAVRQMCEVLSGHILIF